MVVHSVTFATLHWYIPCLNTSRVLMHRSCVKLDRYSYIRSFSKALLPFLSLSFFQLFSLSLNIFLLTPCANCKLHKNSKTSKVTWKSGETLQTVSVEASARFMDKIGNQSEKWLLPLMAVLLLSYRVDLVRVFSSSGSNVVCAHFPPRMIICRLLTTPRDKAVDRSKRFRASSNHFTELHIIMTFPLGSLGT